MQKLYNCQFCGGQFTSKKECASRIPRYCSRQCYSQSPRTNETKLKQSIARLGRSPWNKGVAMWEGKEHPRGMLGKKMQRGPVSDETRRKLSESHRGKKYPTIQGAGHWNWQGGVSDENERIRRSGEYKEWRRKVFERDGFQCQECGQQGGYLHADHIKPFAFHPELRFDISNGRTLCKQCHYETDTFGSKALVYARNYLSQTEGLETA